MAFKMRENSLFAVLLRSPWWYSVGIALAIVGIVEVLFRGHFTVYGVFAALPFLVIAGMAAYRAANSISPKQLAETEEWVRRVPAREFRAALASSYEERGYIVKPFKGNAAELQVEKDERVRLVCCKRVKAANTGTEPLRALVAAGEKHEVAGLIYIGMGELSGDARALAEDERIELLDTRALAELLGKRVQA